MPSVDRLVSSLILACLIKRERSNGLWPLKRIVFVDLSYSMVYIASHKTEVINWISPSRGTIVYSLIHTANAVSPASKYVKIRSLQSIWGLGYRSGSLFVLGLQSVQFQASLTVNLVLLSTVMFHFCMTYYTKAKWPRTWPCI